MLCCRAVTSTDLAPATESSAQETASDASYSVDEQPEERRPSSAQARGAIPSSIILLCMCARMLPYMLTSTAGAGLPTDQAVCLSQTLA